MALISVIIPVYNTAPWLPACLDSVAAQTLRDIQVILVDDGSTDGSGAICEAFAQKDGRFSVLHKENGGVASAVAAGLRAAEGAYVGFLDSDDWLDPGYYEELYGCCAGTGADIAEGQMVNELPLPGGGSRSVGSRRSGTVTYEGAEDIRRLESLYLRSFLYDGMPDRPDRPLTYSKCDKLFRRELVTANLPLYDQCLSLAEDAVLIAAVLADCQKVVTLRAANRYHRRVLAVSVSHGAADSDVGRIAMAHEALLAVAEAKGLDRDDAAAFTGSMVYTRIYRAASAPGESTAQRCGRIRRILAGAPEGCLETYVKARGGLAMGLYYTLLRLGLLAPCVWLTNFHAGGAEQ